MDPDRDLDVVLWGATGFTGRLVAAYLLERFGAAGELRWALGGRNRAKLEALRGELGRQTGVAADALPLVLGDGDDAASLEALAGRTRVVCTTVGPYARYGSKLVAACARGGTHYCDLTGEVQWMRRMIDAHGAEAESSGARIVHNCGFDSIPSDVGVFFLQREMQSRHGVPCARIKLRVKGASGGFSGGTVASLLNVLEEAQSDPEVRRIVGDPYGLNPEGERAGPDGRDSTTPAWDADFREWTAPFVMAGINTKVVRRTNALLGFPYGKEFRYDEAMLTGGGPAGWLKAAGVTAGLGVVMAAGAVGPLRRALGRFLPDPGEGPSEAAREAGYFDLRLFGAHPDDRRRDLRARITGDRDPGYGSTARMLGESAVCLARDALTVGGGFWTPAAAMGGPLLERLQSHAGLRFSIED
jgi:short subunit dehydrogenase-like uncharacterized protein